MDSSETIISELGVFLWHIYDVGGVQKFVLIKKLRPL